MNELNLKNLGFDMQDLKVKHIHESELEAIKQKTGSYEALFSKIARKYKELDLKSKNLTENDFKRYILGDYTFLKRPVILIDGAVFVGNAKKTIEEAKQKLQ
jgi:arsenate reductase